MTPAQRAALRQGLATSGAALGVGIFGFHQPFLCVLATQLIAAIPCPTAGGILRRLVCAAIGTATGLIILSGFPQQPWLAWPIFGAAAAAGCILISRHGDPACVILFGMGICSSFPAGVIHPVPAIHGALDHAGSLSIAVAASWLARTISGEAGAASAPMRPIPLSSGPAIGTTVVASVVAASLFLPHEFVVMTVAAVTTSIALESPGSPSNILQRAGGAVFGAFLSIGFMILISGSGNNLAIFLAALGLVFAVLEGAAVHLPHWSTPLRQSAAVFAVMATMLPRPDLTVTASDHRLAAIFVGLALAAAVHVATTAEQACKRSL